MSGAARSAVRTHAT